MPTEGKTVEVDLTEVGGAPDWEIVEDAAGVHAIGPVPLTVAKGGRIFKRRAIRVATGKRLTWLVGELDGVRVYFNGTNLVMTKEDLYP